MQQSTSLVDPTASTTTIMMQSTTILSAVLLAGISASTYAKPHTATLHIYKGRGDTVILSSRGTIPDLGGLFGPVEDPSALLAETTSDTTLHLDGSANAFFRTTTDRTSVDLFSFPSDDNDITMDWDACADLNLQVDFEHKETLPLALFGVVAVANDGEGEEATNYAQYLMLPVNGTVGDSLNGRGTVNSTIVEQQELGILIDEYEPYTTCWIEWANAEGETQRVEVVLGKELTIVYIVVGAAAGSLVLFLLVAAACVCSSGRSSKN